MNERATTRAPEEAGRILKDALSGHKGDLSVADAAAKAGIPLRDAELGLHWLSKEYQGRLAATDKGELLFRFPRGFSLPFTKRPGVIAFFEKTKRAVVGAAKVAVRAWVTIVMLGYVAVFLAVMLAMMFGGRRDDDRGGGGGAAISGLLNVVVEALWWTFHPFSPLASRNVYDGSAWGARAPRARREKKEPFFERVNRFVFGPEPKKQDPLEMQRRLLTTIRRYKGRIGIADVLRVTGLPRDEADPLMSRLLLDYDGDVSVSDDGGITCSFPKLRVSAVQETVRTVPPVWHERVEAPPITGNDAGSNLLIAALNGFNLLMSTIAIGANLTVDRVWQMIEIAQLPRRAPLPPPLPYDGIPWALGVIPLVFSAALFVMPAARALWHRRAQAKAAQENGRRAVLRQVLDKTQAQSPVTEQDLVATYKAAAGAEPDLATLRREVLALGGDVDVDASGDGRTVFAFRDLQAEKDALEREREAASEEEAAVGEVVYRA